MKAIILAGGLGTRITEESHLRPKPMIEIGGKPILWHIMKLFSYYNINEFIICCGYRGYMIKEYFSNYFLHMSDVTFDIAQNKMQVHQAHAESWKVTLLDTGAETLTGGRLKRARSYIGAESFFFTYGDGLADINLSALLSFHQQHGKQATVTAIQPPGRYGALDIQSGRVQRFQEKPIGDGAWINGGFFVLEPTVLDLITNDQSIWEEEPLQQLSEKEELMAYQHTGFWQSMDTLRDKAKLEALWNSACPPWRVWE